MKTVMKAMPAAQARTPERMESRPSDAPTVSSWRYLRVAGRAPARSTLDSSSASWAVKRPVITPSLPIWDWMLGAEATDPSRMMASLLPMLRPVSRLNLSAPCGFKLNCTSGALFWSTPARAFFRSRPVITASRRTR